MKYQGWTNEATWASSIVDVAPWARGSINYVELVEHYRRKLAEGVA